MIRTTPQPGDIGLTRIEGPVGALIRLAELANGDGFADFQHAFVVLDDGLLIEAMPGGARIRPLAEYNPRHVVYVSPASLTDDQRRAIAAAARRYEGVGYSAADYFALALHRFHIPVPGLRRFIQSRHTMICSQLADAAYDDAGVHIFRDLRWPGFVTPLAIYNALAPAQS